MTVMEYIREGRPATDFRRYSGSSRPWPNHIPRITCTDGFDVSVQAGELLYATPRDDLGPWTHVEVGFPSERPEPWEAWAEYVEDADKPTGTVYSYVPVEMVEALIALHGGEL